MGWFAEGAERAAATVAVAARRGVRVSAPWSPVPEWQQGHAAIYPANYYGYAKEGYSGNEIVYACIEELSTSAAEPRMRARYGKRWSDEHAILRLLERPNPFMDRFEFWATVVMHRSVGGNAYAVKVKTNLGRPAELWLMRPDRVRIVPSATRFIERYEYDFGGGVVRLAVDDVIHWKTRNPLDDFYGMPPIAAIAGRIDVDNFMRDFTKSFFENRGVPGGMLSVKRTLSDTQREEIRNRFKARFGGANGWHELLVLDNTEAAFTPMTQGLGAQGLVVPELNEISESRIAMGFGVPLSLIGTLAGAGNSSYGNKKSERESFYNETIKPMWRELEGPVNRSLVPDFPGCDAVEFDQDSVGALSGDVDLLHDRIRKDLDAGLIPLEEAQRLIGYEETIKGTYYVPGNLDAQPLAEIGKPDPLELPAAPTQPAKEPAAAGSSNGNGR